MLPEFVPSWQVLPSQASNFEFWIAYVVRKFGLYELADGQAEELTAVFRILVQVQIVMRMAGSTNLV